MSRLYPQLLLARAKRAAEALKALPIEQLRGHEPDLRHTIYTPSGGQRVHMNEISELAAGVRQIADAHGWPVKASNAARRGFDASLGAYLHTEMGISASEASRQGVWAFLAVKAVPDVVRWRVPGGPSGTTLENFLGGKKGLRNSLGAAWWRAETMRLDDESNAWALLRALGIDELVQIVERPTVAGNRRLGTTIARTFLDRVSKNPSVHRSNLMRDGMKRVRRAVGFTVPTAMTDDEMAAMVAMCFDSSVGRLLQSEP